MDSVVDTRLGTGGFGFGVGGVNPGVQVPFGAFRLGPDTTLETTSSVPLNLGTHYGGYWYGDSKIRAFSHTHLVGAGVGDWGNLGVMPSWITDSNKATLVQVDAAIEQHAAPFSHVDEIAKPGLYAVTMRLGDNISIRADLAAGGTHAGAHNYAWMPPSQSAPPTLPLLLFDACHSAEPPKSGKSACKNATITLKSVDHGSHDTTSSSMALQIEGSVLQSGSLTGRAPRGGVEVFWSVSIANAAALCPVPWTEVRWGTWGGGSGDGRAQWAPHSTTTRASSTKGSLGAFLVCNSKRSASNSTNVSPRAELRVGISFVSVAQANINANAQVPWSLTFEELRNRTIATWRRELEERVTFRGNSTSSLTSDRASQLYGALYRSLLAPSTYSEVGGVYRGFDGGLHMMNETADERNAEEGGGVLPLFRSDMSLWDVHRSEFPLLRLLHPRVSRDIVLSLVAMARHAGKRAPLPRWPLANIYTGCMVGNHGWNVIADACVKGTEGLTSDTFGAALNAIARTGTELFFSPFHYFFFFGFLLR